MEILRATITISEDAARTANITYQASQTVDLESLLGSKLSYSFSAGTAGAYGGATLFNGVILSAAYNPESDTVTVTASDLRRVVLSSLSNDDIDSLIPSPDIDADIIGYERINKRLEMAPGHVELDVNRRPRYTDYNSNAGSISITSGDAICEPLVGSSSAGSSPVNEITLNVAYTYPVLRTRIMTFNWEAPRDYFRRVLSLDLRLPVWPGIVGAFSNIDCKVIKIGVRFLPPPGLIKMFKGGSGSGAVGVGTGLFLWFGASFVKKVSAVAATLEDRWTQNITERFKIVISAASSQQLGASKKSVSVKHSTSYDAKEWEEDLSGIDFDLVGPEYGSHTNPDIAAQFINGKTHADFAQSWKRGYKTDTKDEPNAIRDYTDLDRVINLAVQKARVEIKRSHRIGRTTVTSIIDPSADVTKTMSATLNKISASGKIGNVVFTIDHEKNTAQMAVTSYNAILKGGADSQLIATDELDLGVLPVDNVTLNIQGGHHLHVGQDFQGLNGSCYSSDDGYSVTSYSGNRDDADHIKKTSNARDNMIAKMEARTGYRSISFQANGQFRFCVSPPDISDESIDNFEIERPEAKQNLTVKI